MRLKQTHFLAILALSLPLQAVPRAEIPEQYKWNLADLFASDTAALAAIAELQLDIAQIARFKGKLAQSAGALFDGLEARSRLNQRLQHVRVYAGLLLDQDAGVQASEELKKRADALRDEFSKQTSYYDPEIVAISEQTLSAFMQAEPRLRAYSQTLGDIQRQKLHIGSVKEEALKSLVKPLSSIPSSIFDALYVSNMPWPKIQLPSGESIVLDENEYVRLRASADRETRMVAMASFFASLHAFKQTLGATLGASVKDDIFWKEAGGFASNLAVYLFYPNIPEAVYRSLIEQCEKSLPTFWRYLKLRSRMLKVDKLHYYDLYAPLVSGDTKKYSIEEAQDLVLQAMAPLGTDYPVILGKAFRERWIDYLPNDKKVTGAYSWGAFGFHPYMLLNYNGTYNSVSTLAHELGHTMQSYLSSQAQPFPTADYVTFVAEVASTFNEALLLEYMLGKEAGEDRRLTLLGEYLESVKGTVFRQTQFAKFELMMHEMAEKGEPLTGDSLSQLYLKITRDFYGHEQGICTVDEEVQSEWSYIPHFYDGFYVYTYATSFTAAEALSSKVLAKEPGALSNYLDFLAAGSSDYPVQLLKNAGVDMTTAEPFEATMRKMNQVMDEIEAILDARDQAASHCK